ncbi:virulence factor EspC [Mycobacterium lepromatosis]|nr:virulence factor EspC [Mycobacterium lepromatosis]
MTDNLTVKIEQLDLLASQHENEAACASSGVNAAAGLANAVATSHGSYCSQFNDTLKMYEATRQTLGESLHTGGIDLAKALRAAASMYSETDELCGQDISSVFG